MAPCGSFARQKWSGDSSLADIRDSVSAAVPEMPKHLGDFSVDPRVLLIVALAVLVGIVSALLAMLLQDLIGIITNAVFYQRWSTQLEIGRASCRERVCQYV